MSYAVAAALQEAVFQRLSQDAGLAALVGNAIFDALPSGIVPPTYVTLGPEDVRDRSDVTAGGAWHRFTVSVVTANAGFLTAKEVAGAVSDALVRADLTLARGRLITLDFLRARARRETGGQLRRIDMTFRARVDDTQ
ncbi:DUF3168 domain-containing protein [uncultured Roseovarius sp.]|uniref:DUF3168 domain-containing protein n=1 Tax=Roseovarius sp. TaxID=1486281 RepID=UPI0025D0CCFE|nr:DUF3168 domain-containing protein [uncultured Roseovarius sp.]